jgi:hypothetical protein
VIPGSDEWLRQSGQYRGAIVVNLGGFAVEQLWSPRHGGSPHRPDRLVAETDPEQWTAFLSAIPDDVHACSGAFWRAGAGTDQHPVGGSNITRPHHIIAPHHALGTQLRQVLHVVVDHKDAHTSQRNWPLCVTSQAVTTPW